MLFSLNNIRIRNKLFLAYSTAFIIIFLAVGTLLYAQVRQIVRESIETELQRTTNTILTMVRTTADVSIKNYMRAVAEKSLEETNALYRQVRRGQMTEVDAKRRAADLFLAKSIGATGRIYCLDSNGIMLINHKRSLVEVDMSGLPFVQDQMRLKEGYLEYEWKEPLELEPREKAVYMAYFEPWDWIITVSSYRDEFDQLINMDDFKDRLFDLGSGESGYPFVLNYDGYMLLHPFLTGKHYSEYGDPELSRVAERIINERNGHFEYLWRNPGEEELRKKVVYYQDIPELRWVVSSSSYYDDFQGPLDAIGFIILASLAIAVVIMLPVSMGIGALITRPLRGLRDNFAKAAEGDFSVRMHQHSRDELGLLAGYFNHFMNKLTEYSEDLRMEIAVRKETEKQLIAMDKTKSLFLASASHELRTPLTSIIGFVKLMEKNYRQRFMPYLEQCDDMRKKAYQFEHNLSVIHTEAERLGRLVNDLLDLSKIEAGRMEWRDEALDVNAVIQKASEAIAAYDTENESVSLVVELLPGDARIYCDRDRIHQVLINLLSNAFKNTEEGTVTLSAVRDSGDIVFSVCDTGCGIPPENVDKIFDIFFQVEDENRRSSKTFGTGLGLTICRQIINHYGNDFEVESTSGKGSCFLFSIPEWEPGKDD